MMPPPTQMSDPFERYLALRVNLTPQNPIVNILNPPAVTAEIGLKTTLPQSCRGACNNQSNQMTAICAMRLWLTGYVPSEEKWLAHETLPFFIRGRQVRIWPKERLGELPNKKFMIASGYVFVCCQNMA